MTSILSRIDVSLVENRVFGQTTSDVFVDGGEARHQSDGTPGTYRFRLFCVGFSTYLSEYCRHRSMFTDPRSSGHLVGILQPRRSWVLSPPNGPVFVSQELSLS